MAEKQKLSVNLTKPQYEWVKRSAEQLGITPADFMRRVLDEFREKKTNEQT